MSLFGILGNGQSASGGAYCHMCRSSSCFHIMGGLSQQMNSQEYYNHMMRQAQQLSITSSSGSLTSGNVTTTSGNHSTTAHVPEPKPNKKLLLLE